MQLATRLASTIRRGARPATLGVATAIIAGVMITAPAYGDLYSGWEYQYETGPYYPSWHADDCINAELTTGAPTPGSNNSWTYSSVDPGYCGGTGANMAAGWIGALAEGFLDGGYCGSTGWAFNSSAADIFAVGSKICSGSGTYLTAGWGTWWTLENGSYQYSPAQFVWSPQHSF